MNSPLCDDPAIVVACPRCAAAGRVRFSLLPHVVRCPRCGVRFWIGRDGHVKSEDEARLVRFVCPRCSHREWMPADFLAAGAHCRTCDGRFYPDDEGGFHSHPPPRLAERMPDRHSRSAAVGGGRSRFWAATLSLSAGALLLMLSAAAWSRSGGESPRAAVLEFTRACLAGRFDDARARVAPEGIRGFDVWTAINFPHAADPMAPKPVALDVTIVELTPDEEADSVAVPSTAARLRSAAARPDESASVERVEGGAIDAPSAATVDRIRVRLLLGAEGEGRRLQTQYWRRGDSGWRFDPERTLAALGPSDEPRAVARPRPSDPHARR